MGYGKDSYMAAQRVSAQAKKGHVLLKKMQAIHRELFSPGRRGPRGGRRRHEMCPERKRLCNCSVAPLRRVS